MHATTPSRFIPFVFARSRVVVGAVALVAAGLALDRHTFAQPQLLPAVVVEEIQVQSINSPIEFLATVEAIEAVDIRARVEGIVQNVAFMPGQRVDEGQLLLEIEPDQYSAALASAEASMAQAEAVAGNAQRNLERNEELARQQSVSQAVLDDSQAAADIAVADVAAAEARLNVAELNLSYTRIEAPVAGEIGRALFTRGNVVSPASGPLARIVQLDPIRVVFSVSESEMVTFRQQEGINGPLDPQTLRLSLHLPNGTTYEHTGRVEYMASEVNPQTGTVPVRTIFANPDRVLVPNQSVNLSILEEQGIELPVVPQSAVLQDREGRFVFVLDADNTVAMRRIVTGEQVPSGWAVTEGLTGGERVVVQGTQRLSDGAEVAPVEEPSSGTAP